jgi:hypothetical protein
VTAATVRAALLLTAAALAGCGDRSFPVAARGDAAGDAVRAPDGLPDPDFGLRRDGGSEGGSTTCVAAPEVCNQIDDDCDGVIDDGFELNTDPANCGLCGVVCAFPNSEPTCSAGRCKLGACAAGFVDLDGMPQNGCECQRSETGQEVCDGRDNNCDGTIDEGFDLQTDPGNCGTCGQVCKYEHAAPLCQRGACRMGACEPGFVDLDRSATNGCEYVCTASNGGVEVCDGVDNDCDGDIDESDPRAGGRCYPAETPGCDAASGVCAGQCALGTYLCLPGGLTCMGARLPAVEQCDGVDNDCDGVVDQGFDLQNDPRRCGGCGRLCQLPNAVNGCRAASCVVQSCLAGWVDLDGAPANGCEYACVPDGPEVCDGKDNDCDGRIDNDDPDLLFPPSNFCNQAGECGKGPGGSARYPQATFPVCRPPAPGQPPDWICNYPASAELDGPNQIAGQETLCDGRDNDCDGTADEDLRPALGTACTDNGTGECKRRGVVRCAPDPTASPICDVTGVSVPPPQHEVCDGKDNDCDGLIDESWDNPAGLTACPGGPCRGVRDDLVRVAGAPSFYMYRYEASRVDATAGDEGRLETRACSRQSAAGPVRPWSSVSYGRAQAACAAAGMRLCRTRRASDCSSSAVMEDEWGAACSAGLTCPAERYPYGCSYNASACNGADLGRGGVVATGSLTMCATPGDLDPSTAEADRAFDLSGNLAEWTDDCRTILGDGTGRRAYTLRGGSYSTTTIVSSVTMSCDFQTLVVAEDFAFPDTGFRCCSSCAPGLADCAGACVDQGTDAANCGKCGNACAAGQSCSNGRCQ